MNKPPLQSNERQNPPWISPRSWPVPWESRTYSFDPRYGTFAVLEEEWVHVKSSDGTTTTAMRKPQTLKNPLGFPTLVYQDAVILWNEAKAEDVPYKVPVGRAWMSRLSPDQFEKIARCPEIWPILPHVEEKRMAQTSKDAVDAFKAQLEGKVASAPASRPARQQPQLA